MERNRIPINCDSPRDELITSCTYMARVACGSGIFYDNFKILVKVKIV